MADPFTLGAISLGTSIAGSGISALGALGQGQAQSSAYGYKSQVAQYNAAINLQNSKYALDVGEQKAANYGLSGAAQAGHIVAAQSSSGVDVNSGSAKAVQDSQHMLAVRDQSTIRSNAAKTAYDYRNAAINNINEAKGLQSAASNAQSAGGISALGSIIGGAGSVASKWLQGSQMGLWGGTNESENMWQF